MLFVGGVIDDVDDVDVNVDDVDVNMGDDVDDVDDIDVDVDDVDIVDDINTNIFIYICFFHFI